MTRFINKSFSGFYKLPNSVQWVVALSLLCMDGVLLILAFISLLFPLNIIFIPVLKSVLHFMATPFLRLCGYLKYYSPMLILVDNRYYMEIHNGTIFDYLGNMRWEQRGIIATKITMIYYLRGLLRLIEAIESKKISDNIPVTGVSYFFSEKTARRIGFTIKKAGYIKRFLFILDYLNLFLMFSYSKGRIAFPNINRLKKVEITSGKLVKSKARIESLLTLLEYKNLAMEKL